MKWVNCYQRLTRAIARKNVGRLFWVHAWKRPFHRAVLAFCLAVLVTVSLDYPAALSQVPTYSPETRSDWSQNVMAVESKWEKQYEDYFGENLADIELNTEDIAKVLEQMANKTQTNPAVLWIIPQDQSLELLLLTPADKPIGKVLPQVNRAKITQVAQRLQTEITDPRNVGRESYLAPAQQLYQWMVQPVEEVLKAKKIDTILFCTGPGLRALPMAALHDGQQFLVEKYSPVRIPAFNLINLSQTNLKQARVLAMGASEFAQQTPLPAVPVELETIVQSNNLATQQPTPIVANQWPGRSFLNQSFTLNNLTAQVASDDFGIVHLATHAEFQPGAPENSYIQLWDEKLRLDQVNQIGWDNPPMELLVLSACRTAIGDREVELGFAGLALYSGVKSALASLWYVSDTGTLALMSEFYQQLRTAPTKSAALQKAQIAMLSGKVRVEKGELLSSRGEVALPPDLAGSSTTNLSHPFYWAGFNLIGTPW